MAKLYGTTNSQKCFNKKYIIIYLKCGRMEDEYYVLQLYEKSNMKFLT